MKHRFPLSILSAMLILSIMLSGCSQAAPAAQPANVSAPDSGETVSTEPVSITVMSFFAFDNPEVEEGVVAAFEAKYPEIDVDFQSVTFSDIFQKYKTLIAGDSAPDVMAMNFDNSYQFAALGALESLDEWMIQTGLDKNIYYESTLDMFKVNGKQFAMPATFSDVVLYYNKDLFDAEGLEYPQKDWTWDDLKTTAAALTKDTDGDGKIDQFGYGFPWWPIVLEMYNAKIWDEGTNLCTLNTPEGIKALQSIVDGRFEDKFAPTPDQLAEQGDWDMFIAGKLAMYPTGPWAVQPFNDSISTFNYDIGHMPAGDRQATHVYANSYAMAAASKNKEAAWKFIEFATGPEGTRIRQDGKYEISPVKEIAEKYYVEALKGQDPEHAIVFMEVQEYAVAQPVHANWQEINDAIGPDIDLALNNQQSVEEAVAAACENADKVLNR